VAFRAFEEKWVAVNGALAKNLLLQGSFLPCSCSSARIRETLRRIICWRPQRVGFAGNGVQTGKKPQISPLRFAPVEMTKGRVVMAPGHSLGARLLEAAMQAFKPTCHQPVLPLTAF
jgi:hypothetical protein